MGTISVNNKIVIENLKKRKCGSKKFSHEFQQKDDMSGFRRQTDTSRSVNIIYSYLTHIAAQLRILLTHTQ